MATYKAGTLLFLACFVFAWGTFANDFNLTSKVVDCYGNGVKDVVITLGGRVDPTSNNNWMAINAGTDGNGDSVFAQSDTNAEVFVHHFYDAATGFCSWTATGASGKVDNNVMQILQDQPADGSISVTGSGSKSDESDKCTHTTYHNAALTTPAIDPIIFKEQERPSFCPPPSPWSPPPEKCPQECSFVSKVTHHNPQDNQAPMMEYNETVRGIYGGDLKLNEKPEPVCPGGHINSRQPCRNGEDCGVCGLAQTSWYGAKQSGKCSKYGGQDMCREVQGDATCRPLSFPAIIKTWDSKNRNSKGHDFGNMVDRWAKEVDWSQWKQGNRKLHTFRADRAWSGAKFGGSDTCNQTVDFDADLTTPTTDPITSKAQNLLAPSSTPRPCPPPGNYSHKYSSCVKLTRDKPHDDKAHMEYNKTARGICSGNLKLNQTCRQQPERAMVCPWGYINSRQPCKDGKDCSLCGVAQTSLYAAKQSGKCSKYGGQCMCRKDGATCQKHPFADIIKTWDKTWYKKTRIDRWGKEVDWSGRKQGNRNGNGKLQTFESYWAWSGYKCDGGANCTQVISYDAALTTLAIDPVTFKAQTSPGVSPAPSQCTPPPEKCSQEFSSDVEVGRDNPQDNTAAMKCNETVRGIISDNPQLNENCAEKPECATLKPERPWGYMDSMRTCKNGTDCGVCGIAQTSLYAAKHSGKCSKYGGQCMRRDLRDSGTGKTFPLPNIVKTWDKKNGTSMWNDSGNVVDPWGKEVGWSQWKQDNWKGNMKLQLFKSDWAWSGHAKCLDDTDQNTELLSQERSATSMFPVPVGAMAIPEGRLPAHFPPASQPFEQPSLISKGPTPPSAEAATQEKGPMRILSPATKFKCCTTLPNDGKGNCSSQLVPDSHLQKGKLFDGPVCWQPPTAAPSAPWPPPCLMNFVQWSGILQKHHTIVQANIVTLYCIQRKSDVAPLASWKTPIQACLGLVAVLSLLTPMPCALLYQ